MKLINKKEFAILSLDKNIKMLIIYIVTLLVTQLI